VTTLRSNRPPDWFWKVVAICAARVGTIKPGRNATRNFNRSVESSSEAVESQASSHHNPVGVSAPSNPRSSAAEAIWRR
jgi:hypothetical protein